jgi:hypothetical protein
MAKAGRHQALLTDVIRQQMFEAMTIFDWETVIKALNQPGISPNDESAEVRRCVLSFY